MAQKIVDFVIQLAVILFAISFHESAHAWAALQFGDTTAKDLGRISLNPIRHIDPVGSILLPLLLYFSSGLLFGYAKPTPVDLRNVRNARLANFWVSAAGPLSNFLLCVPGVAVLWLLVRVDPGSAGATNVGQPLFAIARSFLLVNFSLGLFNLIPIPPLDGSGVLGSLLGPPAIRFFQTIAPMGFLILIVLSWTGILGKIMSPFFDAFARLVQRILLS